MASSGLVCAACRGISPDGMRFCGHCGQPTGQPVPAANAWKQAPRARIGEQRLLTVIFCDMVGSTALSSRLEPEDLHAVVVAFREICSGAIQQLGGTVGQFLGDGLLAYFGYPRAREDDAERAMAAALRIQASIAGLNDSLANARLPLPSPVAVRIGVHSGLIVVTDLGRGRNAEAAAVVGETTNVAARLQAAAAVGSVLVSDAAARLAGNRFEFADGGERSLAGFEAPFRTHMLVAERPHRLRARDRTRKHESAPFFDRIDERALLRKAWNAARRGKGGALVLEAEPGMGKSRLIDQFRSTIGRAGPGASLLTCSPEDRSSSFHPLLTWIRQELTGSAAGPPAALRAALHDALAGQTQDQEIQLAVQLDCATEAERQAVAHSPRRNRRNLVGAFVDLVTARCSAKGPHLLIVEDLHWADEGTLAFVGALAGRCAAGSRMLLLATTRHALADPFAAATLRLNRLPEDDAVGLVRSVVPADAPDELVSSIVQRTSGIPLFVEELARLAASATAATAGLARQGTIPLTLRSTLSAQLDALGQAKGIAQAAAIFGQSFDPAVLAALVQQDDRSQDDRKQDGRKQDGRKQDGLKQNGGVGIAPALDRLATARVIEPQPQPGTETRYAFRHALMRDAAYESIPRNRRRLLHGRIGHMLRDTFPAEAGARPELLAQHFAAAEMASDAAEQFEAAAARAAARLMPAEAAGHCRSGLAQIDKLHDAAAAPDLEIRLHILLASQITVTRGNADPAVEAAFDRARRVAEQIGDRHWLRRALRGLHTFHLVKGDIEQGLSISQRVLELSLPDEDAGQRIQVHRPHGLTLLYMGRFEEARRELLCAISLYDADAHADHRFTYGSDPLVLARCHLGWVEWFLGDPDRADRECAAAVEIARTLDHPHSLAFALAFRCCLAEFCGDALAARDHAAELVQLAERHDYSYWLAWGRILGGWADAMLGEHAQGDAALVRGLSNYQDTGAGLLVPYAHMLRALLLREADPAGSLRLLSDANAMAERMRMGIWLRWAQRRLPI